MSAPFSNTRLRVPPGFQNILECFAREVLRLQPMDIYKFGMDYFDLLLRKRRETGEMDVAKLGAAFEDRYYNSRSFMMSSKKPTDMDSDEAVTIIQSTYRRHLQSDTIKKLTENEAATVIQAAYRSYVTRASLSSHPQDEADIEESDLTKMEASGYLESIEKVDLKEATDEPTTANEESEKHREIQIEVETEEHGNEEVLERRVNSGPLKAHGAKSPSEEDAAIIIQVAYRDHLQRNSETLLQRQSKSDAPQIFNESSIEISRAQSSNQASKSPMEDEGSNLSMHQASASMGRNPPSREPSAASGRMDTKELTGLAEEEAAIIIQRAYRAHSSINSTSLPPNLISSEPFQDREINSRRASAGSEQEATSRRTSAKSEKKILSRKSSAKSEKEASREASAALDRKLSSRKHSAGSTASLIEDTVMGVKIGERPNMEASRKSSAGVPDFDKSLELVENQPDSPRTEIAREEEHLDVESHHEFVSGEDKPDGNNKQSGDVSKEVESRSEGSSPVKNEEPVGGDTVNTFPEETLKEIPDVGIVEVDSEDRDVLSSEKTEESDVTATNS
uniref:Sperm surface protein Sp17 n=1 Tax=Schistocephalus solidus TaxID=70667 RepID=A0A0V0J5Y7_SCHSO